MDKKKGIFDLPKFKIEEMRLKRLFFNADLRAGHEGLLLVAKKEKIDIPALKEGEMVVFINTHRSAFKAFVGGQAMMAHFREPYKRTMRQAMILTIPKWFKGGNLEYSHALERDLKKELRK